MEKVLATSSKSYAPLGLHLVSKCTELPVKFPLSPDKVWYLCEHQKEAGSQSTSVPLTDTKWLQASCWTCLCCCLCLSFSICKHDLEISWWKGQPSWKVFQLTWVYLRKTAHNAVTFLFGLAFLSNLTQKSSVPQRDCQSKQVTTEVPKVAHLLHSGGRHCPESFFLWYFHLHTCG